jgi:hypothetical protein
MSMISFLGSADSLRSDVLSYLLVVSFLFWRCLLRIVLKRLSSVVLVCLRFPMCSFSELLLRHLLHHCFHVPVRCPLLLVVLILTTATATRMVTLCLIASRRKHNMNNRDHTCSPGTHVSPPTPSSVSLND